MNLKQGLFTWMLMIGCFCLSYAQAPSYPWLDGVVSDNCCSNQTATAFDFGAYSFVYIEANQNCTPGGKLYFEDGTCWCVDTDGSSCLTSYNLSEESGQVIYNCEGATNFTPFDQFDWLSGVADEQDCAANSAINVYLRRGQHFVHVIGADDLGSLYSQSGKTLCADQPGYSCTAAYGLSETNQTLSWTCGDGQTGADAGISVYNSFEDATLTGGQQAFYGAAGPVAVSDAVEFPQFINFYDIDVTDSGLTMTLFNNSDAADLLLPEGRFDRYYFNYKGDLSNISVSGGSPGLAANATVSTLPAGYEIPLADLFGTGYPLPITLPDGGFVVELGGGTDLTELGQTLNIDFGFPLPLSDAIPVNTDNFFPEDIVIANNVAYVSSIAGGTLYSIDLRQENPQPQVFAEGEEGFTQGWGVKSDGNILLSLLNSGDGTLAKVRQFSLASGEKTGEWTIPNITAHTISIVDGKYYVTDFASPLIVELDPSTGAINENWFTSDQWDPEISGIGGTIYDGTGGLYISQGNKLWYLPVSGGTPGTLQEVNVSGVDGVDADGISWGADQTTMYYASNDTGDPADVGTVTRLIFSDATTATATVIATGLDDASGVWYLENAGSEYVLALESQFGALFGINGFEPPFNIEVIDLANVSAPTMETGISVYNSFEDATLTGGQQAFYGAAGPVAVSNAVEFPQFINFYDIDVTDSGLTMTLFNNSDAADLVLPEGRFDRYYFNYKGDVSNINISGGSPGLADNATVRVLPAGYEIPLADLFGTGYPLPITLPDGGFVVELGGGTDLTELGQTLSVDFSGSQALTLPDAITVDSETFFPEDIVIANNIAYISSLGNGSLMSIDLTQENPTAQLFAAAEEGYTQRWGVKTNGNVLLSILNNANFSGGDAGPAKLVAYDIASSEKTGEWDLPAGSVGHTVSVVDGKYYVTDFNNPRIFEVDPSTGMVNDSWFTSDQWDPTISGMGGTIYDNEGGFYASQGNKLWYLPISNGMPGTLQEVAISGLDAIDADGISWDNSNNTLYYATNDTGDPANVGTAYKLVFSDATTATGSVVTTGLDDSSGLWYLEDGGNEYVFVLESQFGALFGINSFDPPFSIKIVKL